MIAIHHRDDKYSFTGKWIEYCEKNQIKYKLVNCYQNNIIDQLRDCDGLMWNWSLSDPKTQQFAKQLTFSLEKMNLPVFPNSQTCWHYDDKVGQKYLLESIEAPLVKTFVFYDKKEALQWAKNTEYPVVFKTRNGAGGRNVCKVYDELSAKKLILKSFKFGIPSYDKTNAVKESLWRFKRDGSLVTFASLVKKMTLWPLPNHLQTKLLPQKNYVYFQEFIPDNKFDIRIVVIGNRAFGIKRKIRVGGFKASGSELIEHKKKHIPEILIRESFYLNKKLKMQSLAIDFIKDHRTGEYLIVEISYDFSPNGYEKCPGYWNNNLEWHTGKFSPEILIIDEFVKSKVKDIEK